MIQYMARARPPSISAKVKDGVLCGGGMGLCLWQGGYAGFHPRTLCVVVSNSLPVLL